ncbi:hypothetical protein F384_15805 [Citrobacter amalonaticus Y19]|uniref:Phage integrase central domain-containing protein n=1 Tax=Citrobacter amalonaticus Y19 TaxID=1261127 RepID=A0A0F6TWH4_CITAM|nr:hypothetical protein F384_15805 [Citrobacter amalonaticus Y19]
MWGYGWGIIVPLLRGTPNEADRWSVSYREEMLRTFEKDVFPYIGHRPIKDIKPMELLAVLSKTEARGVIEKVRKVRQRCGVNPVRKNQDSLKKGIRMGSLY